MYKSLIPLKNEPHCFEVPKIRKLGRMETRKVRFLGQRTFLLHMLIKVILFGVHFKMVVALSNFDFGSLESVYICGLIISQDGSWVLQIIIELSAFSDRSFYWGSSPF